MRINVRAHPCKTICFYMWIASWIARSVHRKPAGLQPSLLDQNGKRPNTWDTRPDQQETPATGPLSESVFSL